MTKKEKMRKYNANNKEKRKEYNAQYYAENKEMYAASQRQWRRGSLRLYSITA